MEGAAKEFATFLEGFTFNTPTIPVIANATARPYEKGQVTWIDVGEQFLLCRVQGNSLDSLVL